MGIPQLLAALALTAKRNSEEREAKRAFQERLKKDPKLREAVERGQKINEERERVRLAEKEHRRRLKKDPEYRAELERKALER